MNSNSHHIIMQGGERLQGVVDVAGAKNAVLPIMAACILLKGHTTLKNIPDLLDVQSMIKMLNALNVSTSYYNNSLSINHNVQPKHLAPYDLVTAMRASFLVAGPILAVNGFAKIPLPGGCSIGTRPVDIHLKGFKALGASVHIEHGFVQLQAKKLKGTEINFDFPSVGATENIMMAASISEGTTIINNAAREPEITDLANFLNQAGAKISGAGSPIITIQGVQSLQAVNQYHVIGDRIEAVTLLIAGAITKGDITIKGCSEKDIHSALLSLQEAGMEIHCTDQGIRLIGKEARAISFNTEPFPGFPTDIQAQMMALLCVADGRSRIKEALFENRFMHVPELIRMGADITISDHIASVTGKKSLSGADVTITDLRAGAALMIAALVADGYTTLFGMNHVRRGYDKLPEKLISLGAQISYKKGGLNEN